MNELHVYPEIRRPWREMKPATSLASPTGFPQPSYFFTVAGKIRHVMTELRARHGVQTSRGSCQMLAA